MKDWRATKAGKSELHASQRRRGLVRESEVRSAWLLLGDLPTAVRVAMDDYGFRIGPNVGKRSGRGVVAGHFTRSIAFEDFADAVNEAAHEAVYAAGFSA